ncbi:hypothetical protein [Alkalilimnicola ehrlichii]|uniref:hypothetical protein n=1 Tax=Alkalilimnicola ehrlichii TaxID=351052 RepID=UPI003BA367A4
MLTIDDCRELAELTEEEIDAICEHEHCSEMLAIELGNYLVHSPEGCPRIRRMILDDIEHAETRGDTRHVVKLKLTLKHFCETHPEAADKALDQ